MTKRSSWMFQRAEKEYHSGDRSLLDGRELIQITIPVRYPSTIDFVVRDFKKYNTPCVILKEKGKKNGFCALFRERIKEETSGTR